MKKRGIFRKVFRSMVITSFIAGVIVLAIVTFRQTNSIEESLVEENKVLAGVAATSVETGYLTHSWPFETLKKMSDAESIVFLWIVKPDGEVFLSDDPTLEGKMVEQIVLAFDKPLVKNGRYHNEKVKLIVYPLQMEIGQAPWSLYLGVSLKSALRAQEKTVATGIGVFVIVIAFAAVVSLYFSREITQPLEELKKSAITIGQGNLKGRINIKTGDELEELASTLNQMADDLQQSRAATEEAKEALEGKVKDRTKALRELTETLEEKVQDRTKELQERIDELERFHRLTVGRELKMIELKKALRRSQEEMEKLTISKGRKQHNA